MAIIYFVTAEHSLPSFFPGPQLGKQTQVKPNHHHTKHGIAALVVALALFAFAWFSRPPPREPARPHRPASGRASAVAPPLAARHANYA